MTVACLWLLLLAAPLGPEPPGAAVVPAAAPATSVVPPEQAGLSSDQAVAEALSHSTAAQRAKSELDAALQEAGVFRPRLSPDIELTGAAQLAPLVRDPALPHAVVRRDLSLRADLTVEQVLLVLGAGSVGQHARALEAVARADYATATSQLAREAMAAWLDLAEAQAGEAVAREAVDLAKAQEARVGLLIERERVAPVDQLQARAGALRAQASLAEATNGRRLAQANLNRVLGRPDLDSPIAAEPPSDLPPAPSPLAEAISYALSHRPEAVALAARSRVATSGGSLARARSAPTLSAVAGFSGGTATAFEPAADARVGLLARWRLGGADPTAQLDALRAAAGARQAELGLAELRGGIELEVRRAWLDDDTARQRFAAANGQLEALDEAYRVQGLQYERSRITLVDLQQTLLERQRAALDRARALIAVHRAVAELSWAMGRPGARQG